MAHPLDRIARQQVPRLLKQHLGVPVQARWQDGPGDRGIHMVAQTRRGTFLVQFKAGTSLQALHWGINTLRDVLRHRQRGGVPLLVVPYMGEGGRELCRKERIPWMDLSGNAGIRTDTVVVDIQGRPNGFIQRGRPSSVFAPKSVRVTRFLLQHPRGAHSQREIARAIELDEGYVSKIVRRLLADGLLHKDKTGRLRNPEPDRLLDAWAETEDFSRHRIHKGFVAAKTGDELMHRLSEALSRERSPFAFTGLAGAWLLTGFATFRLATVFVQAPASPAALAKAGVFDEPRGANCWIVVPRDEGVFQGTKPVRGVPCASPVQVYVDLKGHPERSKEAAEEVRRTAVPWRSVGSET